ncbi:hypothetical protein V495_01945 [Pseudogymnoascus sp. VKM F-4514 (FW-929)]|nr:hypothetical protein V495_01945 [Pseudogymnoascus sp. VKM F-4514 (FW-929)]
MSYTIRYTFHLPKPGCGILSIRPYSKQYAAASVINHTYPPLIPHPYHIHSTPIPAGPAEVNIQQGRRKAWKVEGPGRAIQSLQITIPYYYLYGVHSIRVCRRRRNMWRRIISILVPAMCTDAQLRDMLSSLHGYHAHYIT